MVQLIKDNRLYFIFLAAFLLAGGIYTLASGKPDAILYFSENRTVWGNGFFKIVTRFGEEPAYYLIILFCLAYRVRYSLLVAVTGLVVMGVSAITKQFFAEDRPLSFFRKLNMDKLLNLVDGVDVHTGATSFPSGHSMSGFALFSLMAFIVPKRIPWVILLFVLAFLVGMSRIYLVQHFWQDVYAGAIMGMLLAMIIYRVQSRYSFDPARRIDRPLFQRKKRV